MENSTVFIIDNISQTREWLTTLFQNKGMRVRYFNSAERFLYEVDTQQIGCVILANRLPGIDGVSLQAVLNQQQSPLSVLFHSQSISTPAAITALKAGAVNILLKPVEAEILFEAVDEALALSLQKQQRLQTAQCFDALTKKERVVLNQILQGSTNQQIANQLYISLRTVEVHRASIMKKFNASNAVILATRLAKIS